MGIKQRKWQEHLKAAETSGMRLSAYALSLRPRLVEQLSQAYYSGWLVSCQQSFHANASQHP